MEMIAHDPKKAKQLGIKQSVGKDFVAADKGKKFGTGGDVKYTFGGKNQANKQRTRGGSSFGYQKEVPDVNNDKYAGMKAGGSVRTDLQKANVKKTDHGDAALFKKGGVMKTESKSETREEMKEDTTQDKALIKKAFKIHDKQEHKGGKGTNLSSLKKGGSVKGCGCAVKGKTKGKIV